MMNVPFSHWLTEQRFRRLGLIWFGLLLLASLGLGALWLNQRLHVQTDMYALLPGGDYTAEVRIANQRVSDAVNKKIFVLLVASRNPARDNDVLEKATQEFLASAKKSGLLHAAPVADTEALGKTLFAHHSMLLSADDKKLLQQGDYQGVIANALTQLSSPLNPVSAELLRTDPLLFFPRFLLEQGSHAGTAHLEAGWPTRHENGESMRLLIFELQDSAFSIAYQEKVVGWLAAEKKKLQQPGLSLHATGTVLFAAAGSQEAQNEISTIGVGSTLGLIVLILLAYRSPRPLATELAAVGSGSLMAFVVTHLAFGEVHMVTLVFGASLIGVSVDYSMHFLCAQAEAPQRPALQIVRELLPGLLMGLLTTLAAYICLALTPFPGLRQIAVFSAVGLSAAWLTGMLMLPHLSPLDTRHARAALKPLQRLREKILDYRRWQFLLYIAFIIAAALVLRHWAPDDNIKSLQSMNAGLLKDEQEIRQRFSERQSGQYFVVFGHDSAEVAAREDKLVQRLQALVDAGALQNYQTLSRWLPSAAQQQENLALQKNIPATALLEYTEASSLDATALQQWQKDLERSTPLRSSDLAGHPLQQLALSDSAHIVMLNGINDYAALAAIRDLRGVQFVDPVRDLSAVFGDYRVQAQWLALFATLLLASVLVWRYGWRALPDMMGPVLLALASTLLLLQLCGVSINLFNIMALFLILGIGVDYAIFYRESYAGDSSVAVAVCLCMCSTALSFGLLGLSQTPVIRGFGLTVLFGVMTSFFFSTLLTHSRPDADLGKPL
jgi:predicted exporter